MLRQHWPATKSCQQRNGKNCSCQHECRILLHMARWGECLDCSCQHKHASFEHVCIGESALISLLLPLLSPPCCPHCAPMLSSFSCPPCQVCVNAGSLVCAPALAHWCVCPVCTCVLIDPCCLSVKGHQFSHGQHLVHRFSHGYPLVKAHRFPRPATRQQILPDSPTSSPSHQSIVISDEPDNGDEIREESVCFNVEGQPEHFTLGGGLESTQVPTQVPIQEPTQRNQHDADDKRTTDKLLRIYNILNTPSKYDMCVSCLPCLTSGKLEDAKFKCINGNCEICGFDKLWKHGVHARIFKQEFDATKGE
jgi:hypothetical protein